MVRGLLSWITLLFSIMVALFELNSASLPLSPWGLMELLAPVGESYIDIFL